MARPPWRRGTILAGVATFIAVVVGLAAGMAQAAGPTRVEMRIHYSHFDPSTIVAPAGRPVTFIIRNDDPIDHEWIVGDDGVHERHRAGTEPRHDSRPTEVTIPALSTRETTITFGQRVTWRYICHLPGHESYGMVGTVVVR